MRLVVIGGQGAGMSAAARARRLNAALEILVFERGPRVSFSACGLPYYVEGRIGAPEELAVHSAEYFRRERNLGVRTGVAVTAIAPARREVVLAGGERIAYDRLVLATGARPAGRSLPGADLPHVFTLHTLEDATRLRAFLAARRPRRAAVVGAGYLGLAAAEALRTCGVSAVTLLEASADVMGRQDAELTRRLQSHLARFRIELRTGVRVQGLEPDRVAGVAADVVVLAAGFLPNSELAAKAGLELGPSGAIRASERMETSVTGIYAAGDCAEALHLVTGRPVYLPLGTTANKMGRVAGANAAGERERFPGIVGTLIVRCCGLGVAVTGLSEAQARPEGFDPVGVWIEAPDKPSYFGGRPTAVGLVADHRSGRLLGATVLGEEGVAGRINVVAAALAGKLPLEQFQHLDLAYSPPFAPLWDPVLIAAQQLIKLLH